MKTKTSLTKEIVRGIDVKEINNSDFWDKYDSIDMRAFEDIDFAPIGGELYIPEGIERIGFSSFSYAKNLKKVVLPSTVDFIEVNAFKNAKELEEIYIPEGVEKIKNECFLGCSNLKTVHLPSTLEEINDLAFCQCTSLEEITLPDKLKKIDSCAFFKCKALKNIEIPNSVKTIDRCALFECESLKSISIPDNVRTLGENAFEGCSALEKVEIGEGIRTIEEFTFKNCTSLEDVKLPEDLQNINFEAFANCNLKNFVIPANVARIDNHALIDNHYLERLAVLGDKTNSGLEFVGMPINFNMEKFELHCNFQNENAEYFEKLFDNCFKSVYLYKDKSFFDVTSNPFKKIDADAYKIDMFVEANEKGYKTCLPYITNKNFRENYVDLHNKFENKEIKFIPQDFIMEIFPNSQIDNFFVNNNHFKWRELVEKLNLNELKGDEKINSLKSLMKVYYAIGGFSEHMGKRDSAFDYILSYVATTGEENPSPRAIGAELRGRFQDFNLNGEYNQKFAEFFKKYYKDNKDFMVFVIPEDKDQLFGLVQEEEKDYLATAHNKFDILCQIYPYYTVSGNDTRGVFYPEFVANNCFVRDYKNIRPDNGKLAYLCSLYGYSQEMFDKIQSIIDISKEIKKNYLISAVKCDKNDKVQYEFLEKDDPKGAFIGEMTNCCQRLGDLGESCVYNGFTSPSSGFLTFEEKILDEKGEDSGKTQILGQAFIWYDPKTYTVCYDNIELPKSLIRYLKSEGKTENGVTIDDFLESLEKSADALMIEMNKKGYKVDKVTVGQGFNDLKEYFAGKYKIIIPRHNQDFPEIQDENVYTDAGTAQYIIRTYDQTTAKLARSITNNLDNAEELLNNFERQNNVAME